MEVVLMVVHAPRPMEMLGAGDIAAPPLMDAISRLYGFIPVNRGNLDRPALTQALDVLRHGGVLGLFPEGGIWDPGAMEAKRGVAWLSYHARAPILPIGFGSPEGALRATLMFGRPRLVMAIGEPLPPIDLPPGVPRREGLQRAATAIMDAVDSLIPAAYRQQRATITDERFELRLAVHDATGQEIPVPPSLTLTHAEALCKVFYRPAILRIFVKDLRLPAVALQQLELHPSPTDLVAALAPILNYITHDNPGFFPYRFGTPGGLAMGAGVRELYDLAAWARDSGHSLLIQPIRRYRLAGQSEEIVETMPGEAHVW
jgi:1-acyl-sn-glycerol-3-phosphate acyltransferase